MEDIFNQIGNAIRPNIDNRETEVLNKFSPDFIQLCKTNALAKAILNTLIRDEGSTYTIIEHLINSNDSLINQMKSMVEMLPMQRVITRQTNL